MTYEIDELQRRRRDVLMPYVGPGMTVLEVGAFYRPTLLPSEATLIYADFHDTAELERQAAEAGITRKVAPVSLVLKHSSLADHLVDGQVDLVIAHHVLEHVIDPFRWIKELEPKLRPGGRLFFTLPDKRRSFDHRRMDTTFAHFVSDYLLGGERSLPEHCIDAGILYDGAAVGGPIQDPSPRLTPGFIEHAMGSHHPGMHVHVFQGSSFRTRVLEPFLALGWLGFELEAYGEISASGEFYFSLRQSDSEPKQPSAEWQIFSRSHDSLP